MVPPSDLPDRPGQSVYPVAQSSYPVAQSSYPVAQIISPQPSATPVTIDSDSQSEKGGHYTLDGSVVIHYEDRTLRADHVEYETSTGEVLAQGHLMLTGGANHEQITASHGTLNLNTQKGRFYDVTGSVGMKPRDSGTSPNYGPPTDPTTPTVTRASIYTNGNPFLFTGRIVVKTGPEDYDVFDGTVTTCQLPQPDWLLSAAHISMDGQRASAINSIFHLHNLPILYLPYATHPIDAEDRQSGILIPEIGESSSKGFIVGEQIYFVLNRSMDMTVGASYYSSVGWADSASFRYRGPGNDFLTGRYTQVLDRKPPGVSNQGGEDAYATGRHDVSDKTRIAGTLEYLSSYVYREAFDDNFNQAVTSDVISNLYAVRQSNGIETAFEGDRYQGIKVVQSLTEAGQQVHIFHAPALMASATDHSLAGTGLQWSLESSAAGLTRTQPNFSTSGIIERLDLHPELAYPFHLAGWSLRPALGARETLYSRSRVAPYVAGQPPVESTAGLSRSDAELSIEIRPPVIERTFELSGEMASLFGPELRHTIEPEVTYRYTRGIDNFLNVLRFDAVDVASDTDELEYGLTQRIYLRKRHRESCNTAKVSREPGLDPEASGDNLTTDEKACPGEEFISWRLTQKTFIDQQFGSAVIVGRRNIFDTTLALSGVAFLTEPRGASPLISRMRVRTTANTDFEWDFDLDAGAKKFTSNNVFVDVHRGQTFGAVSYARLDAPGRFYTQGVDSTTSNFSQMRMLLGFGLPTRPGLSIAGNAGINLDSGTTTTTTPSTSTTAAVTSTTSSSFLQYASVQASYNWNCCGLQLEYRKYELGSVRNEGVYRFNFTLVNIGTAGNLKRAERLF